MNKQNILHRLLGVLLAAVFGAGLMSSATAGTYSISQTPLFITISMPSNIVFLFDDSGSLQWAHVPDSLGGSAASAVDVRQTGTFTTTVTATPTTYATTTVTATSAPLSTSVTVTTGTVTTQSVTVTSSPLTSAVKVASGTALTEPVTATSAPLSGSVVVSTGTVNHASVIIASAPLSGTVTATCTGAITHHTCSTGTYAYGCSPSNYTLNGTPTSGTSSTPPSGLTCTLANYNYSCPSGYSLSPSSPTSGSSSTASGYTCNQQTYNYSCSSGYTLNPSSPTSGTSSTGSGYTCTKPNYNYSCAGGYTLSPSSPTSGSSSTGAGYTCSLPQYNYSCASGYTLSPASPTSGSSSTGAGYTCSKPNYNYTCASGYSLSPSSPTSGSDPTAAGYSCKQQQYNYACTTGYTLNPSSPTSGSSSTASGYTCTAPNYNYSCASGYTLSGPSSGSSSTPTSTTCSKVTLYTYSCPSPYVLGGSSTTGSSATPSSSVASCSYTGTLDTYTAFSSVYTPDTAHYKSAAFNPLAYDPTQTYLTGYDDAGNQLANESFTGAHCNPYNTGAGTVNLSTSYQATVDFNPSTSACSTLMNSTNTGSNSNLTDEVNACDYFTTSGTCHSHFNAQAAFYYTYTPTSSTAIANGCGTHTYSSGTKTVSKLADDACYTKVVVSSTSGTGGTDERTNFANWWAYYRTRNLTVNTGANRALTSLGSTFRVAWRDLNTMTSSSTPFQSGGIKDWGGTSYDNRIATFSGSHRTDLFDWLKRYPANNGTALRVALDSIGTYYQTPAGVSSPFAFNPQVTDSPEYVCRPSYAVVFTDGLWNDSSIPSTPSITNTDNTALTLPDGTAFTAGMHPYSDSSSSSLADIAFYYWANSLRSDLGTSTSLQYMPYTKAVNVVDSANKTVSLQPYWNPANDPASWPHMVTFTVSLGQTSVLTSPDWSGSTYTGGYNDLVTGNIAWPAVSSNSSNNVYDLWHAAIDSRGQFFSADTPQDVSTAFNSIVNRIQGRVGSSSAIAVNSTRLDSDTFIYQAQFNSGGWTGEVLAFPINSDGSIGSQAWAASSLVPAAASRSIYSWNNTLNSGAGGGISFLWANLSTTQQTYLNTNYSGTNDGNGSLRLNYLRGDQTQEQTQGGTFRTRSQLLGDIVNSNPEFVGTSTDFGDSVLPGTEGSSYATFVSSKSTRMPMLYVGANDGMMHAVNANTGAEQFDYVPRGIYANLSALTDPNYSHQYYVDGSNIAVDAYVSSTWKTLMVGTTGAGGRDVYLLDVTDPSSFSASSVLWDYDAVSKSDNNLGYTVPSATIARLHDGDWYVLFGNGYNSPNQHAVLYMYNLRTKTLTTFDTGVGSASNPNGMSAPNPVDFNSDRIADAIYAGDLQGNVWKLDVSSSSSSNWKFYSYGTSGGTATPLFTAKDSSGNVQPITDRVQVGLSSTNQVMVYFGTGTYFETNDNTVGTNPPVMSFYGLIDDKGNGSSDKITSRSNLLQQYIVAQTVQTGNTFRVTTAYSMTSSQQGWFMDLLTPPTPGTAAGERVVSDSVLDNGRVIFTTVIPQGSACQFGGISWLMELNADNGASLTTISPFDVNGDGKVNNSDFVTVTYTDPATGKSVTTNTPVGGEESTVGIIKTPGIITSGTLQYKYASGSTGSISMTTESAPTTGGRISWQQIQ